MKKIKSILTSPLAAELLYRVVRAYSLTFRLTVENEETWLAYLKQDGKVLLCGWHQHIFATLRHLQSYRIYRPSIMISQSQDGEMVAGVVKKSGCLPVRGSTSRGGINALKIMIRKLNETRLAIHIVDGPTGPAGIVKDGAIYLAQAADAVIVPFYIWTDRAWTFNSWDRFFVPKPFARVKIIFGDLIKLPFAEGPEDMEKQRQQLENTMLPYLRK